MLVRDGTAVDSNTRPGLCDTDAARHTYVHGTPMVSKLPMMSSRKASCADDPADFPAYDLLPVLPYSHAGQGEGSAVASQGPAI